MEWAELKRKKGHRDLVLDFFQFFENRYVSPYVPICSQNLFQWSSRDWHQRCVRLNLTVTNVYWHHTIDNISTLHNSHRIQLPNFVWMLSNCSVRSISCSYWSLSQLVTECLKPKLIIQGSSGSLKVDLMPTLWWGHEYEFLSSLSGSVELCEQRLVVVFCHHRLLICCYSTFW